MKPSILSMVATGAMMALSGCGSPAMMGTVDGTSLQKVSTSNGTWGVGLVESETDTWVASFNNMVRSAPTPVVLRKEGTRLIENASGCNVLENTVVVDLKWVSVYSNVDC